MSDFAVQMDGVGKDYRHFSLDDIRLRLAHGHIMGFIGPNGAGKSTTIRILLGLVHQDRGEVRLLGHPMPAAQAAATWDVGFASEDMRLYDGATLEWHMRFVRSLFPALDPVARHEVLRELTDVMRDEGRSILFSSHNTKDVEQILVHGSGALGRASRRARHRAAHRSRRAARWNRAGQPWAAVGAHRAAVPAPGPRTAARSGVRADGATRAA